MRRFAIDTGPLVAFLNADDGFHDWAMETLDGIEPPLYTCEAVISEACFLLRRSRRGQDAVLELFDRGLVTVDFQVAAELPAIRKLMVKYHSVPMSLADACLVRMTEIDGNVSVVTLDDDFRIYRRHGRQALSVIMPAGKGV